MKEEDILKDISNSMGVLGKAIPSEKYTENVTLYPMSKGIAQFVLLPVPKVNIEEISVNEILSNKTERMEGKLGSSGK